MEQDKTSTFNKVLGYVTAASIAVYLVWRLLFTLPFSYGYLAVALGLLLFVCEFIAGVQAIINYLDQIRPFPLERPDIPESWYPDVDILIATHDEEENLMYNTVNACRYLDYPDKSKVHVYLCDDGNRPEMRALAERLGVNYIDMPEPKHAKAGNMNNALAQTSSPLVAFLDADMIPRREFLTRIVPYFFLPKMKKNEAGDWVERSPEEVDPEYKVGFVQTPQNFYNPDLFQYNLYAENRIPNEQIYFFRELNVSRNRHNATHLCGSNMIMSRAALAEAGYFATNNITEDHETGIKVQTAGYTTYAIPDCLANGLNPPAVVNLIIQRERWGRGCMQTFYNTRPFLDSRIPLIRRLHYLCTLFYWLTFFSRFVFIMAPILVAVFGVFIVETSLGELLIFWLPYYVLHTWAMARISARTRTSSWSNAVDTIMFPFLAVPILLDMVGVRLKRFKVTDKTHQRNTSANPILTLPHLALFGFSVVGIMLCLTEIIQYRAFYNVIILFWLVSNAKNLLLAIFFMLGRVNDRYFYRFTVRLPAELEFDGVVHRGKTVDLSEGGVALCFEFPIMVPPDDTVILRLRDREYRTEMRCSLIQVKKGRQSGWIYSMRVEDIAEDQKSQFRQIIYERDPTLPETVSETIPVIEDIKVNIERRFGKQGEAFARKLPRIEHSTTGYLPKGGQVTLHGFNYRYVLASPPPALGQEGTLSVEVEPGVYVVLAAPEAYLTERNPELFSVVNWREWTSDPRYIGALSRWAQVELPFGGSRTRTIRRREDGSRKIQVPAGV